MVDEHPYAGRSRCGSRPQAPGCGEPAIHRLRYCELYLLELGCALERIEDRPLRTRHRHADEHSDLGVFRWVLQSVEPNSWPRPLSAF
jgi:hypothetical protein